MAAGDEAGGFPSVEGVWRLEIARCGDVGVDGCGEDHGSARIGGLLEGDAAVFPSLAEFSEALHELFRILAFPWSPEFFGNGVETWVDLGFDVAGKDVFRPESGFSSLQEVVFGFFYLVDGDIVSVDLFERQDGHPEGLGGFRVSRKVEISVPLASAIGTDGFYSCIEGGDGLVGMTSPSLSDYVGRETFFRMFRPGNCLDAVFGEAFGELAEEGQLEFLHTVEAALPESGGTEGAFLPELGFDFISSDVDGFGVEEFGCFQIDSFQEVKQAGVADAEDFCVGEGVAAL